ncbi:uncharacterized protein LOC142574207 isoform X2 [Dermacentor variabilis]|uniref:uncharacterized protein LOC142574207 isoform X2 n=1 Tax=Dermacentor variabilis TaxID=34621 RepID=UPI003F5CA142
MHHPWILAMHILRDYILLVLITSPGSLGNECRKACLVMWCPDFQDADTNSYIDYNLTDPDEEFPCAKLWCPAVKQVSQNKYLCHAALDPELSVTATTATAEVTEEQEELTTHRPSSEEKQKPVAKNPTTHKEERLTIRVPWVRDGS